MRPQITTRRCLVVVAAAALAFGGWNEWHYRCVRARMARFEANNRERAERHERERNFCLVNSRRNVPYHRSARLDDLYRKNLIYDPEPYDPESLADWRTWTSEADYHAGYIASLRQNESSFSAARRNAERHLILP